MYLFLDQVSILRTGFRVKYAILMVKGEDGRTKQKWVALHLKEGGNKQRAEEMLMELRQSYQNKAPTVEDNSTVLFSDYMKS